MTTRLDVIRRAKALGITVRFLKDSGRALRGTVLHEILLTAPRGKVFAGVDIHEAVIASDVDGAPIETLYAPALREMVDGLDDCNVEDCEWCLD